jgi:hypothetical protein
MMSEERRWLQLYADLMERIYNAEQVKLFQASVIEALREADAGNSSESREGPAVTLRRSALPRC